MSNKKHKTDDSGLPVGFGMALAQNTKAMEMFSAMPKSLQHNYVTKAKSVNSKQEMDEVVNSITENTTF